jgi:tRNA-specific 2-thiouridylase
MLGHKELSKVISLVGEMTKDEVRRKASSLGLRTAGKPYSQDVCFI